MLEIHPRFRLISYWTRLVLVWLSVLAYNKPWVLDYMEVSRAKLWFAHIPIGVMRVSLG